MSVIAFIIVFIILALLISWLGNLLSDLFDSLNLGFIDKIGGFVFGIAKGFLLIGVLILLLDFFGMKDVVQEETREKSKLYKTSEKVASWICDNKDGWLKELNEKYEKVEKQIKEDDDNSNDLI